MQALWRTPAQLRPLPQVSKRAIALAGELAALIERINARPRERLSAWLIQDDDGKPLGAIGMRSRFDKTRRLAGVEF